MASARLGQFERASACVFGFETEYLCRSAFLWDLVLASACVFGLVFGLMSVIASATASVIGFAMASVIGFAMASVIGFAMASATKTPSKFARWTGTQIVTQKMWACCHRRDKKLEVGPHPHGESQKKWGRAPSP